MRWLVVAFVATGCVETGSVECADGSRCPEGTLCVATPFDVLCAPHDAVTACEDHDELAACRVDAAGDTVARCYRVEQGLVCLSAGCANVTIRKFAAGHRRICTKCFMALADSIEPL